MRSGRRAPLALIAFAVATPAAGACLPGVPAPVEVAAVVAANTLRLADGRLLRLAGLAEPGPPPQAVVPPPSGLAAGTPADIAAPARAALAGTLARSGWRAVVATTPDRHGRLPARLVDAAGDDLSERLTRDGLVLARPAADAPGCAARLFAAEAEARAGRRGIWADATFLPLGPRPGGDADERRGAYVTIEAEIHSIRRGEDVTFVNLGPDFRRDFAALFPHKGRNRNAFVEPPHSRDIGRRIRLRGVIGGGRALSIRVELPEQWEWTGL